MNRIVAMVMLTVVAGAPPGGTRLHSQARAADTAAGAAGSCPGITISADPARPRQGALFHIRVEGAPAAATVTGRAAGEPLHFAPSGTAHVAHAAAPIDTPSPLRVVVRCHAGGTGGAGDVGETGGDAADSVVADVPLARADYPLERLTVAPRFSAPPDSALAARMRRESELAAEVSRRAHETPRLWSAAFRRPREARITSTFGRGREFNGTVTSRHMGTDYAGAVGAPVHAANRGVVRLADSFFLGGNVVYIDHGAGLVTAYLHLSEQLVAAGDTVGQGQVIGRVGATGRVTGPHLHWITRYGAITVDPASVLRNTRSSPAAEAAPAPR